MKYFLSQILYADDTLLLEVGMKLTLNSGDAHGANIKFLTDLWVGDACPKDRFPTLFNCSTKRNGNVADFHSNSGWQQEFSRNLNDWEVEDCWQLLQQIESVHIDYCEVDFIIIVKWIS
ncbi:hypothetical protein R3W88_028946 [Solanum pinnatisectum]|uniref:Uncharacterized protein n=1 Tax=Solanum pinnatisectum TaxID=50273 RepID=A0AAV9K4B9_9SOLN|nr:hypothetical protein R3W88_028946 [Solanum pinnatisectum]